jgi:DNA (cytosine-5)-methyltransferase 1
LDEDKKMKDKKGNYIDLFSGCGGFSLGLGNAGWQGLFAIEKDSMAFETFKFNLIDGQYSHFSWPDWLPQEPTTIQSILDNYPEELKKLRGSVDLIAGGPPCQGFSLAGKRKSDDPRNKLAQEYIKVVDLVRPNYVVIENVRGFNSAFNTAGQPSKQPYSMVVKSQLEELGYKVFHDYVNCEQFGVPQQRTRFLMIGILEKLTSNNAKNPFELLNEIRKSFLENKGLPNRPITVKEAINDLEICKDDARLIYHSGAGDKGFKQLNYTPPENLNSYLSLMRKGLNGTKPNSLRLARHRSSTIAMFHKIQSIARPGIALNQAEKDKLGIKKQATCVLNADKPSKTLTTLPDDLLHYREPRILTVRESARIQSFPDDFAFKGKYTTGGKSRTKECPRYTQVGNAVPPLLGEVIGLLIEKLKDA